MSLIDQEIIQRVRQIHIKTSRTVHDLLAGAYHSAFKGRGIEFEDVREYQPGDDIRTIDWNVTARNNYPYVKNFREERELTVILLIDLSASSQFGSTDRSKKDLMAELGALLAFSAIQNNDNVGLILFTDKVEKYIPPKKGVRHVLRVIRELLVFQPENRGTDIAEALSFLGRVQKRQGVCFLISDFITENYKKEITLTAKRHDLVSIHIQDPFEVRFPKVGLITLKDLESGMTQLIDSSSVAVQELFFQKQKEKGEEIKSLIERIGAGYLKIECGKSYINDLKTFFRMRERRK